MANDNYQQHGTGTAPDAPGPCMHSIMGHMCKAHGGPKDTCDCYPAPGAPDALAGERAAALFALTSALGAPGEWDLQECYDAARKCFGWPAKPCAIAALLTARAAVVEAARVLAAAVQDFLCPCEGCDNDVDWGTGLKRLSAALDTFSATVWPDDEAARLDGEGTCET